MMNWLEPGSNEQKIAERQREQTLNRALYSASGNMGDEIAARYRTSDEYFEALGKPPPGQAGEFMRRIGPAISSVMEELGLDRRFIFSPERTEEASRELNSNGSGESPQFEVVRLVCVRTQPI